MSEAVRLDRFGLQEALAPSYLWSVPEKPFSVRLHLDLVERLEREVVEAFRSVTSRGSEIGGLLLGTVLADTKPTVVIEDYELIECEYSEGPLYRMGESECDRFAAAMERRAADATRRLSVVGFFRGHTRKGLSLDAEDIAFFMEYFRDPLSVGLLIRPFATRASVAGIFQWENSSVQGDASAQEFPFSRAELERLAADPAPARLGPRGQIVPIASRRVAPEPPGYDEPDPIGQSAPEPERQETGGRPAAVETPVSGGPASAGEAAAPPRVPPSAVCVPAVGVLFGAAQEEPSRVRRLAIPGLAALIAIAALVGWGPWRQAAPEPAGLGLKVEHSSQEWRVSWDRQSPALKNATGGVLQIEDGGQSKSVRFDARQLRSGSMLYTPASGDVSFSLEVSGSRGGNKVESVRVVKAPVAPTARRPAASARPANPAPKPVVRPFDASRVTGPPAVATPTAALPEPPKANPPGPATTLKPPAAVPGAHVDASAHPAAPATPTPAQ